MRVWKRTLGMFIAVAVTVTAVPASGIVTQAAELFYSDKGLDLNIGRYNVGAGTVSEK